MKEGFLQKAGKRSFQAWRKRWFVLKDDELKYYNPATEYTNENLLGVISVAEIQSLVSTKSPKHAFDIITRTRTYNVAAKTDVERDDWIVTLRKASDEKRRLRIQPQESMESVASDSSTSNYSSISPVTENFENNSSKKSKKEKKSKSGKGTLKRENTNEISATSSTYECIQKSNVSDDNTYGKCRASTLVPLNTDKEVSTKPRSRSMADSLTRANSMLQKMSIDDDNTEDIYEELHDALEDVSTDDDLDDHPVHTPLKMATFELPPPREGKTYAFHEIKNLLQLSDKELNVDLKELALANSITYDTNEEFAAINLLKKYLQVRT